MICGFPRVALRSTLGYFLCSLREHEGWAVLSGA
jgi:hypothetical protein